MLSHPQSADIALSLQKLLTMAYQVGIRNTCVICIEATKNKMACADWDLIIPW